MRAFAELNEQGNRIAVHFKYDPEAVAAVKDIPGRRFHGDARPKHWSVPLDLDSGRRLRETFGEGLSLGDALKAWGREAVRSQRRLHTMTTAEDAELRRLPEAAVAWLRPYQRADVALMATANVLNANQPGVGKTVETIYAVQESGIAGPHVVVCPTSLFKDPWRDELAKHAPDALVLWGASPDERRAKIDKLCNEVAAGKDHSQTWLLLNPEMIRGEKVGEDGDFKGFKPIYRPLGTKHDVIPKNHAQAALFGLRLGALVADEFHKFGLGEDRNTLLSRSLAALGQNAARRYALSGTPMGGKPIRLWGVLNFIEPEKYSSKWRWAGTWLMNKEGDGPVQPGAGTGIGDLQPGREEEFNRAHAQHMIRRNRKDALPGLPEKVVINHLVPMTKTQRKVYDKFARSIEVELEGGRVSADGALAEFARLKQFANAKCEVVDGEVRPTTDSGKLPRLLEELDTHGVRAKDAEPRARAIVASESQRFVVVLEKYLADAGIAVRRLDGTVTNSAKRAARDEVIDWYKSEDREARVLVMTTQTGGVGLNLGMTGSIHVMDETWNPDDQEQLEDRGMRDRDTPLNVVYYRSEDSIQEYIWGTTFGKAISNKNILDLRNALNRKGAAR